MISWTIPDDEAFATKSRGGAWLVEISDWQDRPLLEFNMTVVPACTLMREHRTNSTELVWTNAMEFESAQSFKCASFTAD